MQSPTQPPIKERQNSDRSLRLLSAQRQLYSDAKSIQGIRLGVVTAGALASVVAAMAIPGERVTVGVLSAAALLVVGVLGGGREKRRIREAAAVQEEFDTYVFGLPWNDILAERTSPTVIAEAARRYTGRSVRDWYSDTESVVRPLDVLICQRSNMGWGSSMHRLWAACLTAAIVLTVSVAGISGWIFDLSFTDTLAGIIAPLLAPMREVGELVRANVDSAQTKASLESRVLASWRKGLSDISALTEADCRSIQDRILHIRQSNASIPDWLNHIRHDSREAAMQLGTTHMIEEARDVGLA